MVKFVLIGDTFVNPEAVAFIQPQGPDFFEGIPIRPADPNNTTIGLVSGKTILAVGMTSSEVVQLMAPDGPGPTEWQGAKKRWRSK